MTDLSGLAAACAGRLIATAADMAPFLTDWRGLWHGRALAVAMPGTAGEVAACVRWCAAHGVPIVPQGGNTGLSGGATPDASGGAIVLSLKRLSRIRGVDATNATLTADAGCVLAQVQVAASAAGLLFPLSLAAEGSCTIGGNLATNAGGTGVLRYGNARALCLGLEAVTADGTLWDGLRGLRKDNSGYDVRDLLIGSEGTLGIITGAVLRLFPRPVARCCALAALATPQQALAALHAARGALGELLGAAELFSDTCLDLVQANRPTLRPPFAAGHAWYLLLEAASCTDRLPLHAAMESLLEDLAARDIIADAILAQSDAQAQAIWALREGISEAQAAAGPTIKHDIALPLSAIAAFLAEAGAAITARWPDLRFVTFGHLGDGNIHYNFSPAAGRDAPAFMAIQPALNALVHDLAHRHGGSISAEHGLGQLRHIEALRYRPEIETSLMRALKKAMDPQGILNPGKVMP
jgi:FAD/FMN-containing dehydrogenase